MWRFLKRVIVCTKLPQNDTFHENINYISSFAIVHLPSVSTAPKLSTMSEYISAPAHSMILIKRVVIFVTLVHDLNFVPNHELSYINICDVNIARQILKVTVL